jgi:hypothetical protein
MQAVSPLSVGTTTDTDELVLATVKARNMGTLKKPWNSFRLGDCHILRCQGPYLSLACRTLWTVMYLERLKRVLSTERGLHLTFSSGDTEESIELSPEAVEQTSKTLHNVARVAGEGTVLGHQVVRTHEAYGLLLRTQEVWRCRTLCLTRF